MVSIQLTNLKNETLAKLLTYAMAANIPLDQLIEEIVEDAMLGNDIVGSLADTLNLLPQAALLRPHGTVREEYAVWGQKTVYEPGQGACEETASKVVDGNGGTFEPPSDFLNRWMQGVHKDALVNTDPRVFADGLVDLEGTAMTERPADGKPFTVEQTFGGPNPHAPSGGERRPLRTPWRLKSGNEHALDLGQVPRSGARPADTSSGVTPEPEAQATAQPAKAVDGKAVVDTAKGPIAADPEKAKQAEQLIIVNCAPQNITLGTTDGSGCPSNVVETTIKEVTAKQRKDYFVDPQGRSKHQRGGTTLADALGSAIAAFAEKPQDLTSVEATQAADKLLEEIGAAPVELAEAILLSSLEEARVAVLAMPTGTVFKANQFAPIGATQAESLTFGRRLLQMLTREKLFSSKRKGKTCTEYVRS